MASSYVSLHDVHIVPSAHSNGDPTHSDHQHRWLWWLPGLSSAREDNTPADGVQPPASSAGSYSSHSKDDVVVPLDSEQSSRPSYNSEILSDHCSGCSRRNFYNPVYEPMASPFDSRPTTLPEGPVGKCSESTSGAGSDISSDRKITSESQGGNAPFSIPTTLHMAAAAWFSYLTPTSGRKFAKRSRNDTDVQYINHEFALEHFAAVLKVKVSYTTRRDDVARKLKFQLPARVTCFTQSQLPGAKEPFRHVSTGVPNLTNHVEGESAQECSYLWVRKGPNSEPEVTLRVEVKISAPRTSHCCSSMQLDRYQMFC